LNIIFICLLFFYLFVIFCGNLLFSLERNQSMPSVYDLKPKFQNLLRPLVKRLARIGITANMVTLAAMLGSIAYSIWIYQPFADHGPNPYPFLFLGLFLFIRMALNAIDGMLAREHHQQSLFGAYLNEVGDVVSDAALYLPFLDLMEHGLGWVLMIGLCCLTEFVGLRARPLALPAAMTAPLARATGQSFLEPWVCSLPGQCLKTGRHCTALP
jgi:CDP-diacylglycerol--glycerol-3-phosphate 3-phosphatidyltransferase